MPSFLEKRNSCPKDLPGVDFLFVDDGSDDNAWEILQSRGIPYVRHEINLGQGIACNTGILAAIRLGYDVLITMDG
ncbi:MAG: glycosyltransferase, partial [Thermodesulfobacteriota bacterium]